MTVGEGIVAVGIAVTITAAVQAVWQLRPSVQRYQGSFGAKVEWKRLQSDQRRSALLVTAGLVLQLVGLLIA